MRIKEFCKRLHIHRTTALKLEARGLLHPKRDWAGHRRFTDEDLQQGYKLVYGNLLTGERNGVNK